MEKQMKNEMGKIMGEYKSQSKYINELKYKENKMKMEIEELKGELSNKSKLEQREEKMKDEIQRVSKIIKKNYLSKRRGLLGFMKVLK